MLKIILHGCNGRMGRMVSDTVSKAEDAVVAAGIDSFIPEEGAVPCGYPVFRSFEEYEAAGVQADVIVDFSTASAADALLDAAVRLKLPLVLCTTGLSGDQQERVVNSSRLIPLLQSANMSIGINLLMAILSETAGKLADAHFDIEIIEKHHSRKLDAPSGTAMALAEAVNSSVDHRYKYVYDRSGRREERREDEIGISAVRGGTIPGDHEVIFAGEDEVISFSHRAYSRAVFAKGSLEAARFLNGKEPGLYSMADVLGMKKN